MPADQVEIVVAGAQHGGWMSYDIDSDLMTPADAWSVTLTQQELDLPAGVQEGAAVQVRMGGETVMHGQIDEVQHDVDKSAHRLAITGRDRASVLLDCSAAIFNSQQLTLADVVAKVVRPLGITRVRIDAGTQLLRDRVSTEPGDTAWDTLRRAAEANGLWPWFTPDGTLVVGGPDYSAQPVASLVLRRDGRGNNVIALSRRSSIAERFSEVTVLGQSTAVGDRQARTNIKAAVRDTGVPGYRPRLLVDHEATNEAIATARARKVISDARVRSFDLQAVVQGHRTPDGALWTPGQRVHVVSEPHRVDGVFFLMGRRFTLSRQAGQRTTLRMKEDGAWVLDAHPSQRKHRRGKNALPAGRIVDLEPQR